MKIHHTDVAAVRDLKAMSAVPKAMSAQCKMITIPNAFLLTMPNQIAPRLMNNAAVSINFMQAWCMLADVIYYLGKSFTGSKCCVDGFKCVKANAWYSQCLPKYQWGKRGIKKKEAK